MSAKYDSDCSRGILNLRKACIDEKQNIEITWRSFKVFQQQMRLLYRLENLADLPHLSEVNAILAIADRAGIPSARKRTYLSPLEQEFIKLVAVLIDSEQKAWVPTIRTFLTGLGWHPDLRGRNTLNPRDREEVVRGIEIYEMIPEFEGGFEFKKKATRKRGFGSDESQIRSGLVKMGYGPLEVEAILKNSTPKAAACYKYWKLHPGKRLSFRTITNGFNRYLKTLVRLEKT